MTVRTCLLLLALWASSATAQSPLPISLDADSSSFDRKTNVVRFKGLRLSQGALSIEAEDAEATGLDFADSRWRFAGGVTITVESARISSQTAELSFKDHQLGEATLRGEPARFRDQSELTGTDISGRAVLFDYNNSQGTIRMVGEALLQEGSNQISGCELVYDLIQEAITANSEECGERVNLTIIPRSTEEASGSDE